MEHKNIYVPFQKLAYTVYGRYEIQQEYISFSLSGVSTLFMLPEEECALWIEDMAADTANANWLQLFSDDRLLCKIQLKPGKHKYPISLPGGRGSILTLVKVTESFVGEVKLHGFELKKPLPMEAFDMAVPLSIQFIGNSITCGYGNMVSIQPPPAGNPLTGFHTANENAYMSYAMQTARKLNAVSTLVSFSGKGIYRNFDSDTNETMPKIYDRIHLQNKNSALWDHTQQVPDIIVINLGTNDYYGESQNKPLNDSVFVKTYIQFVDKLIRLYPNAKIICVNGPMLSDGWPQGKQCWTRIQTSLKKVQQHFQAKGNTQLYTYFFTPQTAPYGEDYHPSLAVHKKMAEELSTFIKTVVNK